MRYRDSGESLWIFIELYGPSGTRGFRGRMRQEYFDAILEGTYRRPFVPLDDTHWVETEENRETGQRHTKAIIVGRDGLWRRLVGTFHLPVSQIITLAPMTDCSDLFLPSGHQEAASRWEAGGEVVEATGAEGESLGEEIEQMESAEPGEETPEPVVSKEASEQSGRRAEN